MPFSDFEGTLQEKVVILVETIFLKTKKKMRFIGVNKTDYKMQTE